MSRLTQAQELLPTVEWDKAMHKAFAEACRRKRGARRFEPPTEAEFRAFERAELKRRRRALRRKLKCGEHVY